MANHATKRSIPAILNEIGEVGKLEKEVMEAMVLATNNNTTKKPISIASLPTPNTPLAESAVAYAKAWLEEELFNHSMRSYYMGAAMITQHLPVSHWDAETAYVAVMLHDLGLSDRAMAAENRSPMSFGYHGGIMARDFVLSKRPYSLDSGMADVVAEAIFRHRDDIRTSSGHSPECMLLILGTHLDVYGGFSSISPHRESLKEVVNSYPRSGFGDHFARCLVREAQFKPFSAASSRIHDRGFFDLILNNPVFVDFE